MKALLIAVVIVIAFLTGAFVGMRLEQRRLMSKTASLDLQEKCAKQTREEFHSLGWDKREAASFSNHYNEKLNKCFMQVESSDPLGTWKTVSDAFEGKVYAVLGLHGDEVKKCSVTLLSGEEKTCHSLDEFDALVKEYLEEKPEHSLFR